MNGQVKKIEDLTTDIDRLQKQNADLQRKVEKADKLAQTNTVLSKAKEELQKQLVDLKAVLSTTKDDAESARAEVQVLKESTSKVAAPGANDKALVQKIKELEEKKNHLETAIGEWSELASVCFDRHVCSCNTVLTAFSAPIRSTRTWSPCTTMPRNTELMLLRRQPRLSSSSTSLLLPNTRSRTVLEVLLGPMLLIGRTSTRRSCRASEYLQSASTEPFECRQRSTHVTVRDGTAKYDQWVCMRRKSIVSLGERLAKLS